MKTIHDLETNEVIVREMTAEEVAQYNADMAQEQARKQAVLDKEAAKQAVLTKLGLTAEEVAALLS